jgi:hypothetical protein
MDRDMPPPAQSHSDIPPTKIVTESGLRTVPQRSFASSADPASGCTIGTSIVLTLRTTIGDRLCHASAITTATVEAINAPESAPLARAIVRLIKWLLDCSWGENNASVVLLMQTQRQIIV